MRSITALIIIFVCASVPAAEQAGARTLPAPTNAADASQGYVAPYNLVIVNLDASRSFQIPSKQPGVEGRVLSSDALAVVLHLFRQSATQKQRRTDGHDRYVLVAVDAASQVIWRGNREELTQITPDVLASMLKPRRQFAQCTDIGGALNANLAEINREHRATNVYILTFSDLINEPPSTSWSVCASPSGEPPSSVDWDGLQRAALGFYFVSTDFQLRPAAKWSAALEEHGLQADFLDAAQTMSRQVELQPPSPAVYRPSSQEVADATESLDRLKGRAVSVAGYSLAVFGVIVAVLIGSVVFVSRRRRVSARVA